MLPLELRVLLGEAEQPQPTEQPQACNRATLADWLEFNSFTQQSVARQLERILPVGSAADEPFYGQGDMDLSPDEAWKLCGASMRHAFPELTSQIDQIETDAPKCLQPNSAKYPGPFTYDLGFRDLPFVSLHYQGRAADLLAMAHEFGHAVQIVASWNAATGQMPPVARECCAFMAELAVLQHFTEHTLALEAAHRADDAIYLGRDKTSVEAALPDMQAPYQYVWNYPLARHLAAQLVQKEHAMTAGALFHEGAGGGTFLSRWMATPDEDCPAT